MSTIIKHKQFPNHKIYKTEVAGKPLTIDVGKLAELANAAVMVTTATPAVLVLRHRRAPPPGRGGFLSPVRGL
jgi:polyribonucleotide nucleotidyltransferase